MARNELPACVYTRPKYFETEAPSLLKLEQKPPIMGVRVELLIRPAEV